MVLLSWQLRDNQNVTDYRGSDQLLRRNQAAVSGASSPSTGSVPLLSSSPPASSGRAAGSVPQLTTATRSPRPSARVPGAEVSTSTDSGSPGVTSRRTRSIRRKKASVEASSPDCASTVSPAQSAGIGSHGCSCPGPKPYGADVPDH